MKIFDKVRNEALLRDQLMGVFGGNYGRDSYGYHDYCNDICKTDADCGGACLYCVEISNWIDTYFWFIRQMP